MRKTHTHPKTLSHTHYSWLCDVLIRGFYMYFHFITTAHCVLHRHTTQMVPKGPSQEPFPLPGFPISELSGPCFVSPYWSTFSPQSFSKLLSSTSETLSAESQLLQRRKMENYITPLKMSLWIDWDTPLPFTASCNPTPNAVINPDNSLAETFS